MAQITPKAGDIIRFRRLNGLYFHYAVYIDSCSVIHRSGCSEFEVGSATSKSLKGSICEERLDIVAGDYMEVVIANYLDNEKDSKPFTPDEIVKRATSKLGEKGYNIVWQNCEHFATWCRYGVAKSQQIDNFLPSNPQFKFEPKAINVTSDCLEPNIQTSIALQIKANDTPAIEESDKTYHLNSNALLAIASPSASDSEKEAARKSIEEGMRFLPETSSNSAVRSSDYKAARKGNGGMKRGHVKISDHEQSANPNSLPASFNLLGDRPVVWPPRNIPGGCPGCGSGPCRVAVQGVLSALSLL